jgi:hypothetical protein
MPTHILFAVAISDEPVHKHQQGYAPLPNQILSTCMSMANIKKSYVWKSYSTTDWVDTGNAENQTHYKRMFYYMIIIQSSVTARKSLSKILWLKQMFLHEYIFHFLTSVLFT